MPGKKALNQGNSHHSQDDHSMDHIETRQVGVIRDDRRNTRRARSGRWVSRNRITRRRRRRQRQSSVDRRSRSDDGGVGAGGNLGARSNQRAAGGAASRHSWDERSAGGAEGRRGSGGHVAGAGGCRRDSIWSITRQVARLVAGSASVQRAGRVVVSGRSTTATAVGDVADLASTRDVPDHAGGVVLVDGCRRGTARKIGASYGHASDGGEGKGNTERLHSGEDNWLFFLVLFEKIVLGQTTNERLKDDKRVTGSARTIQREKQAMEKEET